MPNDTISASLPSRRAIIAGGSAAAVLGAIATPIVPASASGSPNADPLLAALDDVRRRKRAYEDAKSAAKEIEYANYRLTRPFRFQATFGDESEAVHSLYELEQFFEKVAPHRIEEGIREIGKLAEKFYGVTLPALPRAAAEASKAAWSTAREEAIAAFNAGKESSRAEREAAGMIEAETRVDEAWQAFDSAEMQVRETAPTTAAGGLALVLFCAEYMKEADDEIALALVNAASALSSTEMVVSERLASVYANNWPPIESTPDMPRELLENYHTWLFFERQAITDALAPEGRMRRGEFVLLANPAAKYHNYFSGEPSAPALSRAKMVLEAVGCEWKEEPRQ